MGITIYYKGKIKDIKQLPKLNDELIDIAKIMKWKWSEIYEDFSKPATAHLEFEDGKAEIKGHLPIRGLSLNLHPDCETMDIYFDKEGNLTGPISFILVHEGRIKPEDAYLSVKTQFAPPEIHIAILKLLRFLKNRYIPDLEVHDEGGYWETSDKAELIRRLKFIEEKMNEVEQALSEIEIDDKEDLIVEKLAKIIEEKLKDKLR